jgi:hypothetical protein
MGFSLQIEYTTHAAGVTYRPVHRLSGTPGFCMPVVVVHDETPFMMVLAA